MKLLLAVDGSEFTQRMLTWLADHQKLLVEGADIEALTVVPALPAHVKRHLDGPTEDEYYRDRAEEVLRPVAEFGRSRGWRLTTRSAVGRPAPTIAAAAQAGGSELVVMGSHGHTPLGSVVLGSVAQGVLGSCKVPTLIVR